MLERVWAIRLLKMCQSEAREVVDATLDVVHRCSGNNKALSGAGNHDHGCDFEGRGDSKEDRKELSLKGSVAMSDLYGVALGGTLSILGGAFVQTWQGHRERKRWEANNRKEEYKELLRKITRAATRIMAIRYPMVASGPVEQKEAVIAYDEALQAIQDRIYIADELHALRIYDLWTASIQELHHDGQMQGFDENFQKLRKFSSQRPCKEQGEPISQFPFPDLVVKNLFPHYLAVLLDVFAA
jgi:hypothetical protein